MNETLIRLLFRNYHKILFTMFQLTVLYMHIGFASISTALFSGVEAYRIREANPQDAWKGIDHRDFYHKKNPLFFCLKKHL